MKVISKVAAVASAVMILAAGIGAVLTAHVVSTYMADHMGMPE